jgi:hypothetical protein
MSHVRRGSMVLLTSCLLVCQLNAGSHGEIVLFAFDDYSLPFSKGLLLELVPARKSSVNQGTGADVPYVTRPLHPNKPVLPVGRPGDPDHPRVYYYGTVLRIGDEFRMWYTGWDKDRKRQVCYAVSRDGIEWKKPDLGLVEYNGNRHNNLVLSDGGGPVKAVFCLILHEPEDPDPSRRFKMIREETPLAVMAAFSPDGLRWTDSPINPVLKGSGLETGGLIRFDGHYYLNGQGGAVPHPVQGARKRKMTTHLSWDFEHWTEAAHVSFRRNNLPPRPLSSFSIHQGEQVHMGASLWNRGNVVLGIYGQYHNQRDDRRYSSCDLGLIVSRDAIHFKEPVPDFKIVPAYEEADFAEPRLIQGQGFENVGDRTFFWYSIWVAFNMETPTGVRLATWDRDRLGYFTAAPGQEDVHFLSKALEPMPQGASLYVNADGLSASSQLRVEILDHQLRPVPGYSDPDSVPLQKSGFREQVTWGGGRQVYGLDRPFRIRVNWEGSHQEKARLFAVYVVEGS